MGALAAAYIGMKLSTVGYGKDPAKTYLTQHNV